MADGGFRRAGIDGYRPRQLALDLLLVVTIRWTTIVRKQRGFVPRRKLFEEIEGSDLTARVDRQKLSRFNPKNAQSVITRNQNMPLPRKSAHYGYSIR